MPWKTKFLDLQFPLDLNSSSMQEASALKYENRPGSLFKFRTLTTRSLRNLQDNTVWLADPVTLNDPYDCSYALSEMEMGNSLFRNTNVLPRELFPAALFSAADVASVLKSESPYLTYQTLLFRNFEVGGGTSLASDMKEIVSTIFSERTTQFSRKRKERLNICSFTETLHKLPMWAHYADEHRGFCIEYDLAEITARDEIFEDFYPVQYTKSLFDATEHVAKTRDDRTRNPWFLFRAALTKPVDWASEREWRYVIGDGAKKDGQLRNIWQPKKIHLGARMRPRNAQRLINICRQLNIACSRTELSTTHYALIQTNRSSRQKNLLLSPQNQA